MNGPSRNLLYSYQRLHILSILQATADIVPKQQYIKCDSQNILRERKRVTGGLHCMMGNRHLYLFIYKTLTGKLPSYLTALVDWFSGTHQSRSNDLPSLHVPRVSAGLLLLSVPILPSPLMI